MKEFAPGIPISRKKSKIRQTSGEVWPLVVQDHEADIAGSHSDLRIGDPSKNILYSWASRKGLPKPGEKFLAVRQPDHSWDYQYFKGKIPKGKYGAGKVKTKLAEPAEIVKSSPNSINFNIYKGRDIDYYKMIKTPMDVDSWLVINYTPTKDTRPGVPQEKPPYKEISPDQIDIENDHELMEEKIDGAAVNVVMRKGRPIEVFSYRPTERSTGIINHSPRILNIFGKEHPYKDTIVRGEAYAIDPKTGKSIPAHKIGGLLNSGVWKSRINQKKEGDLRISLHDPIVYEGKRVESLPYKDKAEMLKEIHSLVPSLDLPKMAISPTEKKKMLEEIVKGKNPRTKEGVILWSLDSSQNPVKVKLKRDWDVYVKDIFPSEREGQAGGFYYSHSEGGEIVGKCGVGFDHNLKKDMYSNPDRYIGRIAVVEAQEEYPSGALRMPVFRRWHLEKNIEKVSSPTIEGVNVLSGFFDEIKKWPPGNSHSSGSHPYS